MTWIPAAVSGAYMVGSAIAGRANSKRKAAKRKHQYHDIEQAGGLANYDPTYGAAREAVGNQTEGPGGFYANLLSNFQGRPEDMEVALQRSKPFVAGSLGNTGAFRDLQNYAARAQSLPQASEIMQAYGSQAGQQAAAAGRAGSQSRGMLARSGLGNSAAMASLAGQQQQALAGDQASLFTKMYQASLAQRMQNAQMQQEWMSQAFNAHRAIASMALGSAPIPREPAEKTNLWGPIAQMAGQAIGSYLGSNTGGTGTTGTTQSDQINSGKF